MKKILIGTHNKGKFKEIAYLISKNYKKISPIKLKIPSPKETGNSFRANSKLKASFFSRYVDYPVISDDSGLCIDSLKNRPGILSARLAKKHGGFPNAMKFLLNKMKNKKKRGASFICSLSFKVPYKKIITVTGKIRGKISYKLIGKKVLDMIQFSFQKIKKLHLGRCLNLKKLKWIIDLSHLKNSKEKLKFYKFIFISLINI